MQVIYSYVLYLKFRLSNHRDYFIPREHMIQSRIFLVCVVYERSGEYGHGTWFWAWNMAWNIIRGNHARQPRSSSPKRREFALYFFCIIKHLYTLRSGRFDEILPSMMISMINIIISGNISPNPPRTGYINDKYSYVTLPNIILYSNRQSHISTWYANYKAK